jgi:hypothetical protein
VSRLDDDGGFEVVAIESPDSSGHQQALWVAVRPAWHGNVPDGHSSVWISYQDEYMRGPLTGPVLLSPQTWRELNDAVERQFSRQERSLWRRVLRGLTR